MCGIAGFAGNFPVQLLDKFNAVQQHRGPDGAEIWHNKEDGIGFAHRRLSIIDLSDAATQPMHCVDDRYVIVFNGEIYNFKDLTPNLKHQGYVFNENSDTAILAPLYDSYGPAMLNLLNGIFSFAIWDKKKKELFAARDHSGIMPFYYANTPDGLLFASEIKALLQSPAVARELDPVALKSYLTYLWSPGERTLFKTVRKLNPGHCFTWSKAQGMRITQWYEHPFIEREGNDKGHIKEHARHLRHLMDQVVKDQCLADVPVGAFLSGGVDSSAVVSSMVAGEVMPKQTYCIRFAGNGMASEGFSEDIDYARNVAQTLNVPLQEVVMGPETLDELPKMALQLDEPQADPAPLFVKKIAEAAYADGIPVLLGGTGGDDVFSGYRRHRVARLHGRLGPLSHLLGAGVKLGQAAVQSESLKRRLHKAGYLLGSSKQQFLERAFHYTQPQAVRGLIHRQLQHDIGAELDDLQLAVQEQGNGSAFDVLLYLEHCGFLPDHNLNYTNKAGMAGSVEIRVPFLDKRVLNYAATLPKSSLMRGSSMKHVLKLAYADTLPHDVLFRSKAGFGAPIRQWLAGPARQQLADVLLDKTTLERGWFDKQGLEQMLTQPGRVDDDSAYTLLSLWLIEHYAREYF